jgi:hypothetical protein
LKTHTRAPVRTPVDAPTQITKRWVRLVIGFGVGAVIGLAPYLGVMNVPFFRPLLSLYPPTLENRLIPLSAFAMGLMAVVVQWYGGERVSRRWLRKAFRRCLTAAVCCFVFLILIRAVVVVDVPVDGGRQTVAFVVGWRRLAGCPCVEQSDELCISETITFNPAQFGRCWSSVALRGGELALQLSYLALLSSFGALVGLVVLREEVQKESKVNTDDVKLTEES